MSDGADSAAGTRVGRGRLAVLWQQGRHFGAMLVGVPDYEAYVRHMRETHAELVPMTREQFVRSRMEARLGSKTPGKCPC